MLRKSSEPETSPKNLLIIPECLHDPYASNAILTPDLLHVSGHGWRGGQRRHLNPTWPTVDVPKIKHHHFPAQGSEVEGPACDRLDIERRGWFPSVCGSPQRVLIAGQVFGQTRLPPRRHASR